MQLAVYAHVLLSITGNNVDSLSTAATQSHVDSFSDLECFKAVAETRSFSAAGRRLALTTAGVSKAVMRVEAKLGVRLFTRTTRRVVPTPEGQDLLERASDILARLADAEAEVGSAKLGLRGTVVVTAPVLLGQMVLPHLLAAFRQEHPGVVFDVRLGDSFASLVEDGVDLALRLGHLEDSRLVTRRLASTHFCTCASPDYLARFGEPQGIDDLRAHACITYVVHGSGKPFAWRFADGVTFMPDRAVLVGDGGTNRAFAAAGLGVVQEIDIAVGPDLRSGVLVEVLRDVRAPGPPLSLVQPAGRFTARRVQATAEFLGRSFR